MSSLLTSEIDAKVAHYFPEDKLNKIYREIDGNPELIGAEVTFVPDNSANIIRSSILFSTRSKMEEKVLRASCRADGKVIYIREMIQPKNTSTEKELKKQRSSLGKELIGAGWSCSGAGIGWVLVIAEAGGGTVTVGATWSAMPLTLAATSAATFQCGSTIGRVINVARGKPDYNEWLDESPTFSALMTALDVVQIADVVQTLGKQAILVSFLRNKGIGSGGILRMYKQLPRSSRKRLAEELLKLDYFELRKSRKLLKQVLNGTKLLDDGTKAVKVYTQAQVRSIINTKLAELIGSAITIKGSSGNTYKATKQAAFFVIGIGHN